MPLEIHPHIIAILMFLLALIILSVVRQTHDPSSHWILFYGILLVGLGAWSLNGLSIMKSFFDFLSQAKKMDVEKLQQAQQATALWTLILPAVVAAMGANLITSWSLSKKPNSSISKLCERKL